MPSLRETLDLLAATRRWNYRASRETMSEPAAICALALAAHGELAAARVPADWLAEIQQRDGSVGIYATEAEPRWPTSLAMLAWSTLDRLTGATEFAGNIKRAAQWSLADRGKTSPQSPKVGHDTMLVGWSWAADTASWLEPTCFQVLGLAAAGYGENERVLEGVKLILNRLLPDGGANYGNTFVLGQQLVPHIAPSGIALTALAGRSSADQRIEASLRYLQQNVTENTTPISLSWALIGMTAHGWRPMFADDWIDASLKNDAWKPLAPYEQALLLLAAKPDMLCPPPILG